MSDIKKEGQFRNISGLFHETAFNHLDHLDNIGERLLFENWDKSEPDGSVTENCVVSVRGHGWRDKNCASFQCVACGIQSDRPYKLRGLCTTTW